MTMRSKSIDYLEGSRKKRALELGLIGVASPLLGGAALLASGAIAARSNRKSIITSVDRSLYPGHRFKVKKIGDPEADDRLLRICRQAMIDELPQVIDIIRGDMTLVGPRADKPEHIDQLFDSIEDEELRERWRTVREAQRPGIISSYAVHSHSRNLDGDPEYTRFSQSSEIASNALTRAHLDIHDAENASLRHDLRLLGRAARMAINNYLAYSKRMRSTTN